jgi:hypothetical protein
MTKVAAGITTSLDRYIAGPNDRLGRLRRPTLSGSAESVTQEGQRPHRLDPRRVAD